MRAETSADFARCEHEVGIFQRLKMAFETHCETLVFKAGGTKSPCYASLEGAYPDVRRKRTEICLVLRVPFEGAKLKE